MSVALAHGGLPEGVKPYQLISLVKKVARSCEKANRISQTGVAVLEFLIASCRDADFRPGRICGTWEQPATIAAKLGLSTKVLHNAEAELREKGYIERTSTPHARRRGKRCGDKIVRLEGISLRPLIDGYASLVDIQDAIQVQQEAVCDLKQEISQMKRRIREAGDALVVEQAEAILPRGRTSRIENIEKLEAIKAALEALLVFVDVPSGAQKSSDKTEENFAPIILKEDSSKNCSGAKRRRDAVKEPAPLTPAMAAELASEDYQALLVAKGGPSWPNLVDASATAATWLGISQRVWGEACLTLGRERAAICVLVIDRNWRLPEGHRYRAKSPRHCLIGMAKQARAGGFNLLGLTRAVEAHPAEHAPCESPQLEAFEERAFANAARKLLVHIQSKQLGYPS